MKFSRIASVVVLSFVSLRPVPSGAEEYRLAWLPVVQDIPPAQLVGVGDARDTSGKVYFGSFDVLNDSQKPIAGIQLGWTVHDCVSSLGDPACLKEKPLLK
jgi:hypothetical protein